MTLAIEIFQVLAASTSTMMILSPIPSIYHVYHTKTTGVASIVPLVSMFANCHIAMMFGYLCELYFPVFSTFIVGDLLSLCYICIFYTYTHERGKAHKVFAAFGIPLAVITCYSIIGGLGLTGQPRGQVGRIDGSLGIVATVVLYSSPFEKIKQVLTHKSAVFINIHMVCAGTFNNAMWIVYGYLTREWIIFAPNVFCCAAGSFQIVLYLIFHPRTHPYTPSSVDTSAYELQDALERGVVVHQPLSPSASAKAGQADSINTKLESPCFVPLVSPLAPPTHLKPHNGNA